MKKLIPALFALVLLLVLLPTPEARAYSDEDTCLKCGAAKIIPHCNNDGTHYWWCPNNSCEYHNGIPGSLESCTPGTNCVTHCGICNCTNVLAHSWAWVTDKEATCGEPGTKHEECTRCQEKQSEGTKIDPTGAHTFSWVTDKEPTCGEAGEKHEECSVCHAKQSEGTAIPALGHDWVAPTCTEPGYCTRCPEPGEAALDHKWKAATCTEPKTCERCGATEGSPSGDGHKPGKAVIENEDIHCVSDSSYDEVVYCTVCKQELSRKHVTYKSSHDYQPWEWHETITRQYFKCTKCGNFYWLHNPESLNMKKGLVRYANGDTVDYKAYATGPDDNGVLTVTPIKHTERDNTDDISLYMTPDDVYVWVWEKMNRIELVRDRVVLAIDPREITPEMYGLKENEVPDYYVFTLTPSGKDGWLVRAEALMGEKRIPAEELKGITLTVSGKETEITANGVYKAE